MMESVQLSLITRRSRFIPPRSRSLILVNQEQVAPRTGNVSIMTPTPINLFDISYAPSQFDVLSVEAVITGMGWVQEVVFTYYLAAGYKLLLQSQDGSWWHFWIDLNGIVNTDPATYSGIPETSDLVLTSGQTVGLADSTGVYKVYASNKIISRARTGIMQGVVEWNADKAFGYGTGIVWPDGGEQYRLVVDNLGIPDLEEL